MKILNSTVSWASSPKACTDCTIPLRVMNVPKMVRKNVRMTNVMFHTRSMLRRSCTITECRNAVDGKPGQCARVLDGVPSPETAPPQLLVRPDHPEGQPE